MVEVGFTEDAVSRSYDVLGLIAIVVNLVVSIMLTFSDMKEEYGTLLTAIEHATVAFFALDYLLRLWTAPLLFPKKKKGAAVLAYIVSFAGIIDLLSFLPYYLPFFFPAGAVAFRMFRVLRIFRLFRINAYYDSLNVITAVIVSKRQQLLSSMFIIIILMTASSLCMYSLENAAQPDVFDNAFSGIWWSASTLLTVGYGDIYPITTAGKLFGIFITFLGCGMVAVPTGIISAGFVEQYQELRRTSENGGIDNLHFIKIKLGSDDSWTDREIKDAGLPKGLLIAAIIRNDDTVVPRGDVKMQAGDVVVITDGGIKSDWDVELKELVIMERHPWNNMQIKDLDISRRTFIVSIKRGANSLLPKGELRLEEGDRVVLYTKRRMNEAISFKI